MPIFSMMRKDRKMTWSKNVKDIAATLLAIAATKKDEKRFGVESALSLWTDWTMQVRLSKSTVFIIGNGASASMASHVAADLAKNAYVRTEVFTDLALITAIANDLSFREIFSEPLKRRLAPGDMVVAISSSGESPNILQAAQTARDRGGIVVTLSAMKPDNPLRELGDLNFYIPGKTYGMAETCHAALLHCWIDKMIAENNVLFEGVAS